MPNLEDVIKPVPGARFSVLDSPVAIPGFCVVCRSGANDGRKYLDFGFDLDWYGAIYFCGFCLSEGVGYLGWLNPELHQKLINLVEDLTKKLDALEVENAKLRTGLNALNFLGIIPNSPDSDDDLFTEIDEPESPSGDGTPEVNANPEPPNDPESNGSINERRREDIQSDESSNEDAGDFGLDFG